MALSWFRAADLQKLVVFCDLQNARATLCGLWAGRPSKTRGFLRFSKRPRDPLRTLGWSTFENSWFFCDFQIACATLCGLWAGRPSKTRGFLRFSNRPRDPLRTLGWSTFENSWFFAIFKSPARPSADFGLVDLRKLVVFCDVQIARATLCGLWAGRPLKTRGFFAMFNSPARPSAEFRVAKSLSSWRGAHFLKAVNPKPLPSQGDLRQSALDVSSKRCRAIGIASDTLLKNFSLGAHARAQFFSLNFCYRTFFSKTLLSKLFSRKSKIPQPMVRD